MLVRDFTDQFDAHFPGGGKLLAYMSRARIDCKALIRGLQEWESMESKMPMLTIEVTNICNSNCIFCAHQHQAKFRLKKGMMSDTIFARVLNDYHKMGGTFVGFTPFSGEPLLDPKIIERIRKVHDMGMWTGFFTNGIPLNHMDVEALLKSGVNAIVVSTGPLEQSMYELIYRNRHYKDVLKGLEKLLIARSNIRPDLTISINIRSHISKRKALDLPDFKEKIHPLLTQQDIRSLIVQTRGYDTWGGVIKQEDLVGMMRLALPPLVKKRPCSWTWGLYVTWEGDVRACSCRFAETEHKDGKDELYLGNIIESSLHEIWVGEKLKNLRRRFRNGALPALCRKCTVYRAC